MKSNRLGISVIVILFAIIVVGAWYVIATPAYAPSITATSTPPAITDTGTSTSENVSTSTAPSDATLPGSVTVSSPAAGATVGQTFSVTGIAPNNWYFEAVLPIQVVDAGGTVIASTPGQAQSDWMVEGPVAFAATITLSSAYSGPANLIIKRDNPSGLPQNDAEIIVPIVISTIVK